LLKNLSVGYHSEVIIHFLDLYVFYARIQESAQNLKLSRFLHDSVKANSCDSVGILSGYVYSKEHLDEFPGFLIHR
jgi:hypothetical protein